jgi:hypothetical protein
VPDTASTATKYLQNLWDDAEAANLAARPLDLLRYRSNLLGADLRITNFGGGNTSSKFDLPDPLTGEPRRVMAVKGSGGDLASIGSSGFAVLYMDNCGGCHQATGRGIPGVFPPLAGNQRVLARISGLGHDQRRMSWSNRRIGMRRHFAHQEFLPMSCP